MVLQNLYYYSWYPEVSTNATTENVPVYSDCLSSWSARIPGKKWIGWILLVVVFILTVIVAYNVFAPSSFTIITEGQFELETSFDHYRGQDENNCIALSRSAVNFKHSENMSSEGYVLVRLKSTWHPYCQNDWSNALFGSICDHMNMSDFTNATLIGLKEFHSTSRKEAWKRKAFQPQILIVRNETDLIPGSKNVININESDNTEAEWTSCKIAYLKCGN